MASKKHSRSFEEDYIRTICRVQREEIGFQPTLTFRNRKKYDRAREKRNFRTELAY